MRLQQSPPWSGPLFLILWMTSFSGKKKKYPSYWGLKARWDPFVDSWSTNFLSVSFQSEKRPPVYRSQLWTGLCFHPKVPRLTGIRMWLMLTLKSTGVPRDLSDSGSYETTCYGHGMTQVYCPWVLASPVSAISLSTGIEGRRENSPET